MSKKQMAREIGKARQRGDSAAAKAWCSLMKFKPTNVKFKLTDAKEKYDAES